MIENKKEQFKIIGGIGEWTVAQFIQFIERTKYKVFDILIHSGGGEGEASVAIYDYIKVNKLKASIYCLGRVESAGMTILAAGTRKISYPNTIFMIHEGFAVQNNKRVYPNLIFAGEHDKKIYFYNKIYQGLLPDGVKVKRKATYFTSEEALKLKIIDEIKK